MLVRQHLFTRRPAGKQLLIAQRKKDYLINATLHIFYY